MKKPLVDEKVLSEMGARIRQLRIKAGYTSYESFAFDHDLPRVQYWRLENGTNFTIKSLLRLIDIHDITLDAFFREIGKGES